MKRTLTFLAILFACLGARAADTLLAGSIDFDNTALWGREVRNGFDDAGTYTGATYWYADAPEVNGSTVQRREGTSLGYLSVLAPGGAIHRTIRALGASETAGPTEANGQAIPANGLYIDADVTFGATPSMAIELTGDDKLNVFLHVDETAGVTNLVVTAGYLTPTGVQPTNYVTSATGIRPDTIYRFTAKAIANASSDPDRAIVGFALYLDGNLLTCEAANYDLGDTTGLADNSFYALRALFPSLQQPATSAARATTLYSLGFSGLCEADFINFTKTDPIDDPTYDEPDYTMLRESADITVDGYAAGSLSVTGFPLLVRISEELVRGFHYSRTAAGGADIRFTDENGNATPCEIDTWNTNGVSLVWVRVPFLRNKAKVTMHWALTRGKTAPKNDPHEVWSDYIAVWHMNEADQGLAKDATGHGYNANVTNGVLDVADGGFIGKAGRVTSAAGDLTANDCSKAYAIRNNFSFSGWFVAPEASYGEAAFGKKSGGDFDASSRGWVAQIAGDRELRYYANGADYVSRTAADGAMPDLRTTWFHTAISYADASRMTLYLNGAAFASKQATISVDQTPIRLLAHGLCGDEIRLSDKAFGPEWYEAECAQMTNATFLSFSNVAPKGTDNYWVAEPSVTPSAWASDAAPGEVVVFAGTPRFGSPIIRYYDEAGYQLPVLPSTPGAYRAIVTVDDGLHEALRKELQLVVYDKRSYRALPGHDRVMLFNSDTTPGAEVGYQGAYDVDSQTNAVWTHSNEPWKGSGSFVLPGITHVYRAPETGKKLWEFRNARVGNLFQGDRTLADGMNFLPWGGYACRFADSTKAANYQRYAGTLILRNVSTQSDASDPAAAYSPRYVEGVGTVYFDAVNAWSGYTSRLQVQMTTDAGEGDVRAGTWTAVPVAVFAVVDGKYDATRSTNETLEAVLDMNKAAGTTNWFYRIRAAVDVQTPVRFRIVRTDSEEGGWGTGGEDGEGLVSIDNIIVSYPAMGVKLEQYGAAPDPTDATFRGWRAPFDIPYPGASDLGKVHAMMKANYIVNGTNTADASLIGALTLTYRWRYLDQSVGDWKEILLKPAGDDPTQFISTDAIEGEGEGDIEYRATAIVNAPYYDFTDYSGLTGWTWPDGYTERRGNVELNAEKDGVYSASNPSAALGTDYFIRIRDGASAYQGFRLHVKFADDPDKKETVVPMSLYGDNTWRGFYQTVTNCTTNILWRLEGVNPQTEAGKWKESRVWYHALDQRELPVNDAIEVGASNVWTRAPYDGVTGYLLFQIDDSTRALTIIHADYQNFNQWTDANKADGDVKGHFVGTSTAMNAKSGSSRTATSYAATFAFNESIATNRLWEEHFDEPVLETGTWAINVHHSGNFDTPNGWGAANGVWVPEKYRYNGEGRDSLALQLDGEGAGQLIFAVKNQPRGIGTVAYNARVAQSYDIDSFCYFRGTNEYWALSDYTFGVTASMKCLDDADFDGIGAISAVANYDDNRGCYEARVERYGMNTVRLSLWKWQTTGRTVQSALLGRSTYSLGFQTTGLDGHSDRYGALFISCLNTSSNTVQIQAGLLANYMAAGSALSGNRFYKIAYEDDAADRHTRGTFGVGSMNCPAAFVRPVLSANVPTWADDWTETTEGGVHAWDSAKTVLFSGEKVLIGSADDYDRWDVRWGRLDAKDRETEYPQGSYGFRAPVPEQSILIQAASSGSSQYRTVATVPVTSFGFTTVYSNALHIAEDSTLALAAGGTRQDGSCDIVIDDVTVSQWRGANFDDDDNLDRELFPYQRGYGAPTNFVYTTGWIDAEGAVILSPMRTTETAPASIRAPLMDGGNYRGLGLGSIAIAYRNADEHARLVVQVATNDVSLTELSDLTESFTGWSDVQTFDFSTMTEGEREAGVLTCYLGFHGITGVARVVVDPTLVEEAHDSLFNPRNSGTYGQVIVTGASAKDNPALDSGSWWGWNLRTTDDEDLAFIDDVSRTDASARGLSFALNNSVEDDVRADEEYKGHMPFLQTPVFTRGVVGEISFKARKYRAGDPEATISVYGTFATETVTEEKDFEYIGEVRVTSDRFADYAFTAPQNKNYTGFRLAVTGVDGVVTPGPTGAVERVLIDEVAVFEAIRSRLGFRNVGAFRNNLTNNKRILNMPSRDEQPLCNESWGVQVELYAAQLAEKVDYARTPKVYFHWYEGVYPWGYENWSDNAAAQVAELSPADGEKLVYRSSLTESPGAVVMPSTKPGTIVQYSLEVVYYMQGNDLPMTNVLTAAEWTKPSWYEPLDCNAQYGNGAFAAYNILDTVAPGWAWLNEVNLFGTYDRNYNNSDSDLQYVEVAVPAEADLSEWSIRMLEPSTGDNSVRTNVVATFGTPGLSATKENLIGQASGMVFRVIASLPTRDGGRIKSEDGTLDGVWSFPNPGDVLTSRGDISELSPFGIQLVRASGIVEHEIVVIGTNYWADSLNLADQFNPTNTANYFNKYMQGAHFVYVGDDDDGESHSLSVWDSRGEASNFWDRAMIHTPGRINTYENGRPQLIPPTHPTPQGSTILVYANLGEGGHIRQTVGDVYESTQSQILFLRRNSDTGTNISYVVDKWYELGNVFTNGAASAFKTNGSPARTYQVTVGKYAQGNVTVTAEALVAKNLRDLGVDESNRYKDAIIDWFEKGVDLYGNPWPDSEGAVYPAKFKPYRRNTETNMTLTQMYWLDMTPTVSNQYFVAGFEKPSLPIVRPRSDYEYEGDASLTNVQMSIYMAISNGTTGAAWAPYVLRGVRPGETSWEWATNSVANWTSVTFKVTGILANGITREGNPYNWIPLRWFVFGPKSFYSPTDPDPTKAAKAFLTEIEVKDPYSTESPGFAAGWKAYVDEFGYAPVFYGWSLDERRQPVAVDVMEENNYYEP